MNEIMTDFIVRACAKPFFNLIHSAGKAGYSRMKDALEREKPDYARLGMDVRDYIYDMPQMCIRDRAGSNGGGRYAV